MHKAIYAFSFMKPFAPSASDVYAHVCMSCVQSAKKALEDFGPVEVASLANRLVWVTPLPCGLSLAQMKLKLFSWSYFYRLPMLQVASLKSWDGKPAGEEWRHGYVLVECCWYIVGYGWWLGSARSVDCHVPMFSHILAGCLFHRAYVVRKLIRIW